jgi:hypothetical protein
MSARKPAKRKLRSPARPWVLRAAGTNGDRFQASSDTAPIDFDEFYVGDWFGMERMDTREWWMRIGIVNLYAHIAADGTVRVTVIEGGEALKR